MKKIPIKKTSFHIALIALLSLLAVGHVSFASEHRKVMLGWVGLWNNDMVQWAENGNRLGRLCPHSMAERERSACKKEVLAPRVWKLPLLNKPDAASGDSGEILITATPGRGLSAAYRPPGESEVIPFETDLYDPDWGYGPYFHQTVLELQDDWVLLPKRPFNARVWVNVKKHLGGEEIIYLEEKGIYRLDKNNIVISGISKDGLWVRPEQAADMWCTEGEPPSLKKTEPKQVRTKDLFDKDGHLRLKPAYMRGC